MIVGLGLMGGSYAKGLKRLGFHVSAIDQREESIRYALEKGIIDEGFTGPDPEALARADAVIFALYPGEFLDWIRDYQHLLKSGAMLTDVTGVKSCIVYEVQKMLRKDVEFIASTGANTIRLPFHYKLFTDEDYMGLTVNQDGFARVDSLVNWCRDNHLYLILDMHDAPGGQTGDNIDDSYGYPWLFESEASQQLFCDIWRKIADYYKNEPVILGYELINEPIAPYFENMEELNGKLEAVHKLAVKAIREVDNNHIVLIGGSQWNGNFKPFKDSKYDDKLMYTCHRYGGEPTKAAIQEIINFRDSVNLPMYMGEIGHNTDEWQTAFCKTMEENNIGYTFWPYKKLNGSSFLGINAPDDWDLVVAFSEASRGTYKEIRDVRPRQELVKKAMLGFIENSKCENCMPQTGYIRSLGLQVNK